MTLFIVLSSIFVYFLLAAILMGATEELWDWCFHDFPDSPDKLGWYLFWPIILFFAGLGRIAVGTQYLTRQSIRRLRRR